MVNDLNDLWICAILVGVMTGLCLYLIRKLNLKRYQRSDFKIEKQLMLAPRVRLVEVRIGQRHLILGVTPQQVNYICDADDSNDNLNSNITTMPADRTDKQD